MNKTTLLSSLFSLAALFIAPRLVAQQNCDAREYATFVAYAQGLDPLAEGLGRRMLQCGNRDYRESSYYWLGFFYGMTDHKEKIKNLAIIMPPETDTSPKAQAQRAALMGDTKALEAKVSDSTAGYIDDPWILMSLARSQVSLEQYSAAYTNYSRVLKLKEDQDAAEIELLFAYIWAQDLDAARGKLASLRRFESSPYMKQSLGRAERLLGANAAALKESGHGRRDWLSLAYIQERDNRGYAAMGGKALYKGLIDVEIEALQHEHPLEEEKENVAGIDIGKHWGREHGLRLLTDIGWYSAGDDHLTGKLALENHFGDFEAGVYARRKQVSALERPPGGERAGLMRDSVGWNLSWHERIEASAALHREDSDAIFEDYKLEIKLGSLLEDDKESGFGFIIPVSYRHRPMASPDYRSYPHDLRIGLGIRLLLSDGLKYMMRAEAVIDSINRDDYGAVDSYSRLLGARMETHLRYYFQKDYYNFFEGSAYVIDKMPGEKSEEKGSEFLIGIGVSQESH